MDNFLKKFNIAYYFNKNYPNIYCGARQINFQRIIMLYGKIKNQIFKNFIHFYWRVTGIFKIKTWGFRKLFFLYYIG